MKKNWLSILLLIAIIFILVFTIVIVLFVYSDYSSEDVKNIIQKIIPIAIEEKTENNTNVNITTEVPVSTKGSSKIRYSNMLSEGNFYYNQLTENQKLIYNGFQNNKNKMISGDYVIEYGEAFNDILEQENGPKILQEDYQTAIEAFTHDNVDLFYLDITKLYLNIETIKRVWSTKYNVYIGPKAGTKYYNDSFSSQEQVEEGYNIIRGIEEQILQKIGYDTYNNVMLIHDYLIEHIEFDSKGSSNSMYTMYGALVEKKCVCDGYARAFKYLLNSAGIDCEIIQGVATNSSGNVENHAWNAVKINDEWYYVDVTWDDPIIIGKGYVPTSYYYAYFLKGSNTFKISHVLDGKFSDSGHEFEYPRVSVYDY